MRGNGRTPLRHQVADYAAAATEQLDIYCTEHPESPSAMRRPKLFFRSDLWIALLGPSMEEGIVGIGPNVSAALRAFDTQYVAGLPNGTAGSSIKTRSSLHSTSARLQNC